MRHSSGCALSWLCGEGTRGCLRVQCGERKACTIYTGPSCTANLKAALLCNNTVSANGLLDYGMLRIHEGHGEGLTLRFPDGLHSPFIMQPTVNSVKPWHQVLRPRDLAPVTEEKAEVSLLLQTASSQKQPPPRSSCFGKTASLASCADDEGTGRGGGDSAMDVVPVRIQRMVWDLLSEDGLGSAFSGLKGRGSVVCNNLSRHLFTH